jgi:hypothetical protein
MTGTTLLALVACKSPVLRREPAVAYRPVDAQQRFLY